MGFALAAKPSTSLSAMSAMLFTSAGNLTSAGNRTNTWNYNNFLTQVSGTGTSTYAYDHAGQRVLQLGGGATSTYPSKFFSVATSTNGKGTTTEYIYAGNDLVATIEGTSTASAVTRYIHPDHLGSTNVVSDANKSAVQTLDYYPYGGTRIDSGTDVSQREYIGQFLDEQNGLSYLNARYYEGTRAQFLSQDPTHLAIGNPQQIKQLTGVDQRTYLTDPQSQNSYSYARNNPVVNKDPQGNFAFAVPLYYAAVTAPSWGPAVAGGIIAAGTYIASDIVLRSNGGMRQVPFDYNRLVRVPDQLQPFDPPGLPPEGGWLKWAAAGAGLVGLAADIAERVGAINELGDAWRKTTQKDKETQAGTQNRSSPSVSAYRSPSLLSTGQSPNRMTAQSQSGGGGNLNSLLGQLSAAISKIGKLLPAK